MVWYGIFIFHRQYNVISKKNSNENSTYTANERRAPYNTKVVLPHYCCVKHTLYTFALHVDRLLRWVILSEPIVPHPCGKRQLTVLKPVSDVAIICRLLFDLMGDWNTFPKSHGLNACFGIPLI